MYYKTTKMYFHVVGSDDKPYYIRLVKNGRNKYVFDLDGDKPEFHHGIYKTKTGLLFYIKCNLELTDNTCVEISTQGAVKLLIDNDKEYLLHTRKYNYLKDYTDNPAKYSMKYPKEYYKKLYQTK